MQELVKKAIVSKELVVTALKTYEKLQLEEDYVLEEQEPCLSLQFKKKMQDMCKTYDLNFPN